MKHARTGSFAAAFALGTGLMPSVSHAQGSWDAMLNVDPFPSPYYSDWDANPNIGSLTVMNHTGSAEDIRIFFTITDRMNRVLARGTSEPERIAAGAVAIYDSPYEIAGSGTHDAELEQIAVRTGRLPEGDYTACAAAADLSGFVLAEACAEFFIAYPDPPLLLAPDNGATLTEEAPIFQWTPVQVPLEYQLSTVLRIVELLPGQLPGEALTSNIPVYEERDAFGTALRYPLDARPLEPGKTYAWSVRALDQNGYAASANEGQSEVWTFEVADPAVPVSVAGTARLTLTNTWESPADLAPENGLLPLEGLCEANAEASPGNIGLEVKLPPVLGAWDRISGPATVYRTQEGGTTGAWSLQIQFEQRSVLMYGECGATAPALGLGGLRWIAVRRTGNLGDLLDGQELPPTPAGELPLRFGAIIVALAPGSTALPAGFDQAQEFLNFQEIDLRLGVNLFAMIDVLRDTDDLPIGAFLKSAGYSDRYVAFQGFAGLDTEWSVGGFIGSPTGDGVDVMAEGSRTRTVLTLQASLPPREPRYLEYFETAQVGLRIDVMDSTGIQVGTGARTQTNRDLLFSGTIDLMAREGDGVFASGSHWYGSFGWQLTRSSIDTASARARAFFPGAGSDTKETSGKWVLKLGVDELGFGADGGLFSNVFLSGLQLEIDILTLREAILEWDRGTLGIDAIGTAAIGVGQFDDLGQLTIGLGRKGNEVRAAATPATSGPRNRPPGPLTKEATDQEAARSEEQKRQNRAAGGVYDPVDPDAAEEQAPRSSPPQLENAGTAPGSWHWGARVSIGNMSMGELIQLIKEGLGAPPGDEPEDGSDE